MEIEFIVDPCVRQLNVVNPTASDLGTNLGINRVRQAILSAHIQRMVTGFGNSQVRSHEVINQIRSFCATEEESIWAILLHSSQLARGGFIL